MFTGHDLVIINSDWMIDLTTFIGYSTELDKKGNLKSVDRAFSINKESKDNYSRLRYNYYRNGVPFGVVRKVDRLIEKRCDDALVV